MDRTSYREVRAAAQADADRDGFDRGVEKLGSEYTYYILPQKQNRYGHELRCEVVMCSDLSRCARGHGPMAR